MTLLSKGLGFVLLSAGLVASGQRPAPFTVGTSLVVVPVVAVDKKGATVDGMTQEDFQIFEDGKPVEIQTFLAPAGTAVTGEDGRFIVIARAGRGARPQDDRFIVGPGCSELASAKDHRLHRRRGVVQPQPAVGIPRSRQQHDAGMG